MYKVLITGSTGFIGKTLVAYLSERHVAIFTLDRTNNTNLCVSKSYTWSQIKELPDVDCVVHLAGKAHDVQGRTLEDEYIQVNVGLTDKLLHWFTTSNSTSFVYMSTVKAVRDVAPTPFDEEYLPSPTSVYGRSKLEAETLVRSTKYKDFQKWFILRPSLIYGPNCKGNLMLLYKWITFGVPYPLGHFENSRSYLSITNLMYVLEQINRGKLVEGTYNIADKDSISTVELVKLIGAAINKRSKVWYWNKRLIKGFASVGSKLGLYYIDNVLSKMTDDYLVDTKKLRSQLGSNLPVEINEGMLETFKSFNDR